jgi:hypothetical protein
MRVDFVRDSDEKIILIVDGLKISFKRKISAKTMLSLEEGYHLALRIEKV